MTYLFISFVGFLLGNPLGFGVERGGESLNSNSAIHTFQDLRKSSLNSLCLIVFICKIKIMSPSFGGFNLVLPSMMFLDELSFRLRSE